MLKRALHVSIVASSMIHISTTIITLAARLIVVRTNHVIFVSHRPRIRLYLQHCGPVLHAVLRPEHSSEHMSVCIYTGSGAVCVFAALHGVAICLIVSLGGCGYVLQFPILWWKVTGGYGQVLVALTTDMLKALKEYSSFEFCTAPSHIILNDWRHAVILAGNCAVVTVFP